MKQGELKVKMKGLKEGIFELKWRAQKDIAKVPVVEAEVRIASEVNQARVAAAR